MSSRLIGSLSGIGYVDFIAHLGPIAMAGLFLNWGIVHWRSVRAGGDRVAVDTALGAPEFQRK